MKIIGFGLSLFLLLTGCSKEWSEHVKVYNEAEDAVGISTPAPSLISLSIPENQPLLFYKKAMLIIPINEKAKHKDLY